MVENPIQLFDYADSYPGYITYAPGSIDPISPASTILKERYGGVRECVAGQGFRLRVEGTPCSNNCLWCAIGFYDADMKELSRPSVTGAVNATNIEMEATAPSSAAWCRPSARFFDDGFLSFEAEVGGGRSR